MLSEWIYFNKNNVLIFSYNIFFVEGADLYHKGGLYLNPFLRENLAFDRAKAIFETNF